MYSKGRKWGIGPTPPAPSRRGKRGALAYDACQDPRATLSSGPCLTPVGEGAALLSVTSIDEGPDIEPGALVGGAGTHVGEVIRGEDVEGTAAEVGGLGAVAF